MRFLHDELQRPPAARGPLVLLYTVAGLMLFPAICVLFLTLA